MRRLRGMRLRQFLTQTQLGERVGVPLYTVQRWESGLAFPRPGMLGRLCTALGVAADDLVEPDEWPASRAGKTAA